LAFCGTASGVGLLVAAAHVIKRGMRPQEVAYGFGDDGLPLSVHDGCVDAEQVGPEQRLLDQPEQLEGGQSGCSTCNRLAVAARSR
jgi:hypothetical protein